ncbi:MAG: hypothetical protein J1G04_00720 [Clostridiales bacterium]|nr:hypothetical protein [Clostridiales bacterium]
MKRLISFILVICLALCFVGCDTADKGGTPGNTPVTEETLGAPTNLSAVLSGTVGVVTWAAVDNATSYTVTLNGDDGHTTSNTYYQILNVAVDYTISVVAHADGYTDSAAATVTLKKPEITIGIIGSSEVHSEGTLTLSATVGGTSNSAVTWSITDGGEYATIETVNNRAQITAKAVDSDKMITVRATSAEDSSVYAIKRITITAKPELTQGMLDALEGDKIGFEGYLIIDLYSMATNRFYTTFSYDIKTAMDGTNWFAQYEAGSGILADLYYKNKDGIASLVSVSFTNEESFTPMEDRNGNAVSWEDSGLYNNFVDLDAADFPLDEKTWRRTYDGDDDNLAQRVVASACPYDFEAKNLSLIIEDGEVAGIYAESEDDYTVAEQYVARMSLTVAINIGDDVKVPTIHKYDYDEEFHAELKTALENMQALDNYTMDFLNIGANVVTSSYDMEGFEEAVTSDVCHFKPYLYTPDSNSGVGVGTGTKRYTGNEYGYVDRTEEDGDPLYNTYYTDGNVFKANRAYAKDFFNAKPSLTFAAELFTKRYVDEVDGTITYYVDSPMSSVASLFYYGVGNDVALYGLFAQEGYTSATSSFTPYVVVKDGYIVESGFYYYLGYLYGVVEIAYGKFNETTIDDTVVEKLEAMETRQVPTSWSQVTISVSSSSANTAEDEEENALDYLKDFFKDDDIADKLPYFGVVLGDTYGFGLTQFKLYQQILRPSIVFYFDVPLDVDYSIETSLEAVRQQLYAAGYKHIGGDVFAKGEIYVQPLDNSLDLNINVWRMATTPAVGA